MPSIIPTARTFAQATLRLRHFLRSFSPTRVHPNLSSFHHSPNSHFKPFTNSSNSNATPPVLEHDPPNSPQTPPVQLDFNQSM